MNLPNALTIGLLSSAVVTAIIMVLVGKGTRRSKVLYTLFRLLQLTFLVIAFSEPVITCNTLSNADETIPVLLDVSQSMARFDVSGVISKLDSVTSVKKSTPFSWYLFGDSLRPWNRNTSLQFSDHKSTFPLLHEITDISSSGDIILVSDGAWSGGGNAKHELENCAVWYPPLSCLEMAPWLHCTSPDTVQCISNSDVTIPLSFNGYIPENTTLRIFNGNIPVDSVQLETGSFFVERSIAVSSPGRGYSISVIRCEITGYPNLSAVSNILLHAIPDRFTYTINTRTPSLDIRFVKSVFASDSRFTYSNSSNDSSVDVMITDQPLKASSRVPVALLLPGSTGRKLFQTSPEDTFISNINYSANPFRSFDASGMPPVEVRTKNFSYRMLQHYFSAIHRKDTIPLIFSAAIEKRHVLVCALSDFWKWDFLPLAYATGETDKFRFSRRLIQTLHEMITVASVDTFLLFPSSVATENRNLNLCCILPAKSPGTSDTIGCTIRDSSDRIITDTILSLPAYRSLIEYVSLPPLPKGKYRLNATPQNTDKKPFTFSFVVNHDNSELSVQQQNDHLLSEIGRRLDLKSASDGNLLFRNHKKTVGTQRTETRSIPLRKGWWLFSLLCGVFILEWAMRKFQDLD